MESLIAWGLATLGAAFVGSFLGGYLKKKGENLATHEDIDKLVEQVKAVTTTTKEIEAKISTEVWDRQKRWELRRDILFETAGKAGRAMEALGRLCAVFTTEKMNQEKGLPERTETRTEVAAAWNEAASDLQGMLIIANASCGLEFVKALLDFTTFMSNLSLEITAGRPEAFLEAAKEIVGKSHAISRAIRKELEIPLTL